MFSLRCPEACGKEDSPDICKMTGHYCVVDTRGEDCDIYNEYLANELETAEVKEKILAAA